MYTEIMKLYEYVENFKIKYCDVDFKDEMKISTALALMEEVACASADELGFGYTYIKPRGHAFMVANIYIAFARPARLGEIVQFKTWPLPPAKVTFGREYQMLDTAGEIIANASSRWCLIDMQKGKLAPSKVIDNQDYSTYNTTRLFEDLQWKIPVFALEEGELRFSMTVANSEYDHNFHVNNTRYADYCLNCFTVDELSSSFLKGFRITYVKQCKEGEKLRFYRKQIGDKDYLTQGVNEANEIVVQAQVILD